MIRNRDIIIVGQQSWDTEIGSNCKNIAIEFSKHNRVLYISTPLDRKTKYQRPNENATKKRLNVILKKEPQLESVHKNLWVWYHDVMIESINWVKAEWLFDFLNRSNNRKLAKSVSKAIDSLGFTNYILFNDGDMFRSFYLKDHIAPSISVYYLRDNYFATEYWRKHGTVWEPRLISQSDACMVNSEYLGAYCARFNKNVHYVGQGCDLTLFKPLNEVPADLADLKSQGRPIIGYVGALLSSRLDIPLLENLLENNPSWSFVFVGPEDKDFEKSKLHQLPNGHFFGSRKPEELPSYINAFDVCINPQVINGLTIGNYPRKIDEYLALGKPVVATKTEAMELFKDYVFLAKDLNDYQNFLQKALIPQSDELVAAKIKFANSHTWENSVNEIYRVMADTEKSKA